MELSSPRRPAPATRSRCCRRRSRRLPLHLPCTSRRCERLRAITGLVPVEFPTTRKLDASARERADDLNAAFADPEIRAVLATVGGDDQITVVPHLDADARPGRPEAVPRLQRQHQPSQLALDPRRRRLLRRVDPGAARAGARRRPDPRALAARRAADWRTAGDHRAG